MTYLKMSRKTVLIRNVIISLIALLFTVFLFDFFFHSGDGKLKIKGVGMTKKLTNTDGENVRVAEAKRRNQAHLDFLRTVYKSFKSRVSLSMTKSATHAWMDLFAVSYDCDMYDMRRIGVPLPTDGGKWFCDDWGISSLEQCHVYSLGSNNDYSYEKDLHAKYPSCSIDVFDCTITPQVPKFVSYHNWCLGTEDGIREGREFRTLSTMMNATGVERIHIFKIDIEWAEWETLPQLRDLSPETLPVIIQIEIHLSSAPWDSFDAAFNQAYQLQKLMAELGYFLVAKERNYLNPTCAEFVYYRP